MDSESSLDLTQSEDNENLQKLMLTKPTCNPVLCTYVTPKTNETNDLKVAKDNTLTMDFLIRGVSLLKELPNHLKETIFSKCAEFIKIMHRAYVACIKLYHIQYTSKTKWDKRMYNLQIPCIDNYLQGSFFVPESDAQKERLTNSVNELIDDFSMGMYLLHEKILDRQATTEYLHMQNVFIDFQAYTQQAAFCDLEDLKTYQEKEKMLRALQQSLNLMCKFAFPQACETCTKLLDAILLLQEFEEGEPHEIQLKLPKFDETFLFQRVTPLTALIKPPSTPAGAKNQTLKTTQVSTL